MDGIRPSSPEELCLLSDMLDTERFLQRTRERRTSSSYLSFVGGGENYDQVKSKTRVSFCNEVVIQTIPDCWDYLADLPRSQGDDPGEPTSSTRAPLKSEVGIPQDSSKTLPKPIPQRPIHPRFLKIQCVTAALAPTEGGNNNRQNTFSGL